MPERADDPCERLLREWHFRRGVVQSYYRAMLLQDPSGPDDIARQRELRRELNAKLTLALLGLRHISDQLQACEHERAATHPPRA
jgi:hypothetical protein